MPTATDRISSGLTLRVVVIGLITLFFNFRWMIEVEAMRESPRAYFIYIVPLVNVVFILFFFSLWSLLSGKFAPQLKLTSSELMALYVILSLSSSYCTHALLQILLSIMGHAYWFATPENEWEQLLWRYLPNWLTVSDRDVLQGFYEGESTLYSIPNLKAWISPLLSWGSFVLALSLVMFCFNLIFRRQWIEKENLAYPTIQLPLAIVTQTSHLLKTPLLWTGFALAGTLTMFSNLNFLEPTIPAIQLRASLSPFLTQKPWSDIGSLKIAMPPYVLAICFLIPLELAFSCCFFFFFLKLQYLVSSLVGWRQIPSFPFANEQAMGAALSFFILIFWLNRKYLLEIWDGLKPDLKSETGEPIPLKLAIGGLCGSLLFLLIFSARAGMSLFLSVTLLATYLALIFVVTRIRAQLGFPRHDLQHIFPHYLLIKSIGTRQLKPSSLAVLSLYHWFNRSFSATPMPHQLEGFKIADRIGISNRKMLLLMVGTTIVAIIGTFWMFLSLYYQRGADTPYVGRWASGFGREVFTRLESLLLYPKEANLMAAGFILVGAVFVVALTLMRLRFIWWPFHPLGHILAPTQGIGVLWFCLLVSFILKSIIFKYGGMKLYRRVLPFFYGLFLGDVVIGCMWYLLGWRFDLFVYPFTKGY
ncbi:MAG: hypothetical protein QGI86_22685 [Candidatus Poribacteria bacterium]|nr:hypothetical protein [Candidatus Poribacteria bacterium]